MLVTLNNIFDILKKLKSYDTFAVDTETTGLKPYHQDDLFSIIITTYKDSYYFNFNNTPDVMGFVPPEVLPRDCIKLLKPIFNNKQNKIFMHNAKFDMAFLYFEGIEFNCEIFCTQAHARLIHNQLPSYSLAALGKLIGYEKDDTVEKYISKNKLYTEEDTGKKRKSKNLHYDKVPFEMIYQYGIRDGEVTYKLGRHIEKRIEEKDKELTKQKLPRLKSVHKNELKLTKTLFNMELVGVKIDKKYTTEAYYHELEKIKDAEGKFFALTGLEFEDGRTRLVEAFEKLGLPYPKTAKGNPSFKDEVLPDNDVGNCIKEYRSAYKRAYTYYKNLLDLADHNDVIHCSFIQSGTSTGRMSCKNPNLQNVPKNKEDPNDPYHIRGCFVPRKGFFFVMIDYDQMEYRLLLDIAGEKGTIDKIKSGLDVHTATGEVMGTDRTSAKTLNFMLLYGGGAGKLADALNIMHREAEKLKNKYFRSLMAVRFLIKRLTDRAKSRGYIVNWLGRVLLLDKDAPYRMPNHYIQGGCGDIVKVAMNDVGDYLQNKKSRMLLQIHDELLLEIHESEAHIIPEIKRIMERAYPAKSLNLTCGVEYSRSNWYDKKAYEDIFKK